MEVLAVYVLWVVSYLKEQLENQSNSRQLLSVVITQSLASNIFMFLDGCVNFYDTFD